MYSPIQQNTRKHKRFWQKIVFVRCKKIDKEEGIYEDRQEEADVKKKKNFFKNIYVDLKWHHQNDEN